MKLIRIVVIIFIISCTPKISEEYTIIHEHSWLFLNIDNQMSMTLRGIPHNEIKIYSNLGHVLQPDSEGDFRLRPLSSATIRLKAYRYLNQDSILIHERAFSVKPMPKATATLGTSSNSKMSKRQILAQRGIIAEVINYDIDLKVPIESYTIIILKEDKMLYLEDCMGPLLKDETRNKIAKIIKGGERVIFTNIKAKSNFHFDKYINSIQIIVDE